MKQRLLQLWYTLLVLTGAAWFGVAPVHAASPVTGNLPYQETGRVDGVNLNQNQIIIDDRTYIFASSVVIRSGNRTALKSALSKGMSLGFNSTSADPSPSVITDIWILP